ncbi:hypothetical protein [Aurantiacibacter arachoides]|nr:hypothetical protein [Aurantiacibacter arachoides]GGD63412.1 hypothetical protein GCM10011411_24700 [Aurantiacibacter arachoides]
MSRFVHRTCAAVFAVVIAATSLAAITSVPAQRSVVVVAAAPALA